MATWSSSISLSLRKSPMLAKSLSLTRPLSHSLCPGATADTAAMCPKAQRTGSPGHAKFTELRHFGEYYREEAKSQHRRNQVLGFRLALLYVNRLPYRSRFPAEARLVSYSLWHWLVAASSFSTSTLTSQTFAPISVSAEAGTALRAKIAAMVTAANSL